MILLSLPRLEVPEVDGQVNVEALIEGLLSQEIRYFSHDCFVEFFRHFTY
jgi:hypothetical protein